MGKTLKTVAIGAAVIGLGVATGGIGLLPGLAASSVTIGGATVVTAGVAASLTTTALGSLALGIGASTILSGVSGALARKPQASGAQLNRLSANLVTDAPRKIAFGHTALATDIRYQEWWGAHQEYCSQVIAVASHYVEAIEQLWLNDELAWTSSGGVQGRFVGYLVVQARPQATHANAYSASWSGRWGRLPPTSAARTYISSSRSPETARRPKAPSRQASRAG